MKNWPESTVDKNHILQHIKTHPLSKIKLSVSDIDGVQRGKVIHKNKFLSAVDSSLGFCDVVFGWDMSDVCYQTTTFTGPHSGYPDAQVTLDLSSFRKIPWDDDIPFFIGEFIDSQKNPLEICPRQILKKVAQSAHEMGLLPLFSQEFEWFNFNETPDLLAEKNFQHPRPLTPGMFGYSIIRSGQNREFFNELFDSLLKFNIPLEGLHTETGPGVYEAAIEYAPINIAADRAFLFKTAVKEIALKHGICASFMSKWNAQLPGCSGHIHQSLWDLEGGENLFYDKDDPYRLSKLGKNYLAGILACLPELLVLVAPTINSYKRFVKGVWAPTNVSWGIDNRTTAVRLINNSPKSTRFEFRVPGADVNPYLAMAMSCASGLYGIKHNLKLDISPSQGDASLQNTSSLLSQNLGESIQKLKNSSLAREIFNEKFINHFLETRIWEWQQYQKAITDWELKRYFEII